MKLIESLKAGEKIKKPEQYLKTEWMQANKLNLNPEKIEVLLVNGLAFPVLG